MLERLEERTLLSVALSGVPDWIEQGPGPVSTVGINNFGVELEQAGAINGIAADPADANRLFVGTVNGGVWRTTSATYSRADGVNNDGDAAIDEADEFPHWTPLTDQFGSLSMGAVALSPLDSNTIFAGSARFSSGGGDGGPRNGILKSTDGGNTWAPVGENNELTGVNIQHIIPAAAGTPATQVVLAGTSGGLFRSPDGGDTWNLISGSSGTTDGIDNDADGTTDEAGEVNLPSGRISGLAGDPGNPNRFYAVIPAVYNNNILTTASPGVLRSDDGGATWRNVTSNINTISPGVVAGATFLQLATHNSAGNNVAYVTVWPNGLAYAAGQGPDNVPMNPIQVFRSTNQGGMWVQMDNFPDVPDIRGPGGIAADPTSPTVLFMHGAQGGAMGDPIGNHGRVFRADASAAAGTQWLRVTGVNANGTGPHPDSRYIAFDANGNLLDSDDGGIYRLVSPNGGAGRVWRSVNGDIRPTEFYSTAYDSLNNSVFGGTQDNGSPRQRANGDASYPLNWSEPQNCDGGIVEVDNDQTAHAGFTIQYMSGQNLFACGFNRYTVDAMNVGVVDDVNAVVDGSTNGGPPANTLGPVERTIPGGSTIGFIQPYMLNTVAPTRMVIGTAFLYESMNQGDNFTSLGGLQGLNADGIDNDGAGQDDDGDMMVDEADEIDEGDEFQPVTPVGNLNADGNDNDFDGMTDEGDEFARVSAIAYGGRLNGANAFDVLYVGKGAPDGRGGQLNGVSDNLILRTVNATNTMADFTTLANYPGTTPRDIVLDPDNWQIGYVVDNSNNVYRFINAGAAVSDWSRISDNLGSVTPVVDLRTIELFTPTAVAGDDVVLVGGLGGVYRTLNATAGPATIWTEFNNAGPANQLPNMIVKDLRYTPPTTAGAPFPGDVLLAGTFGRGAWTIENASEVLNAVPVVNICGDDLQVNQDDNFLLIRDAVNPAVLNIFVNGAGPTPVPLAIIQQVNVFGIGGNDTLTVDSSNGLITLPNGIRYDGDGACPDSQPGFGYDRGFDTLVFTQTGGDMQMADTYSVGATNGSGTSTIVGPSGTQTVFFEELEPVVDLVPAGTLTLNATPEVNAINYAPGAVVANGKVTIDNYESIEFSNKTTLTINGLAGNDTISLNSPGSNPAALTGIIVNAGDGDDAVTTRSGVMIDVTVTGGAGDDLLDASGVSGVGNAAAISGDDGNDTAIGGAGNDFLNGNEGDDRLVGGAGNNSYSGGTGFNTIGVPGTAANDLIDANQTAAGTLTLTVNASVRNETFTNVQEVDITAGDGDDVIRVTVDDALVAAPASSLRFHVDGGSPNASDRLNVVDDGLGDTDIYRKGPDDRSGSITIGPLSPVVFEDVEFAFVTPLDDITGGSGADNLGRFVLFEHDPFENNNSRFVATHLGANSAINLDPTIDPGAGPLGVPADVDWYRVEAEVTGTLDFQVFFHHIATLANGRAGLPGNGDISIQALDASGDLIAGFGTNDTNDDERVRIPAVQGQVYFLRVAGATGAVVNNYNVTIINTAAPVPFDIELADALNVAYVCPQAAAGADANSDTGRSRFDNITCDATPTIRFRLNDGGLLHDLPGNSANDSPPDEVVPIPFQAGAGAAGYRIAIFDEGQPQQPGGLPQVPIGFATQVAEGVYQFTFPVALSDGSHFLWARVQMVDPATPQQTGFGANSQSLEIIVDTTPPPIVQSAVNTLNLDLDASSDSGVTEQTPTLIDRYTNDDTPTFFGFAEADTVVRVYVDKNANGVVDAGDVLIAETVAQPYDGSDQFGQNPTGILSPNIGRWVVTSNLNMNSVAVADGINGGVVDGGVFGNELDGRRVILGTFEDQAGNESAAVALEIFIDTRGPQVTAVCFDPIDDATALPACGQGTTVSVFDPKPFTAPTPLTNTVVINFRDLPVRAVGSAAIAGGPFQQNALNSILCSQPGNFRLVGDLVGPLQIQSIICVNDPFSAVNPATAYVTLNFATPLPDDRYTLTVFDRITDEAGNALDGESNTIEPTATPFFPTGDGVPGQTFEARFTVDSRPEVGTFCCGSWYIDLNQNGSFDDPNNHDTDATNGDIVYKFGLPGDFPVVGDWDGNGFDEIGVYGRRPDGFRFELDSNGNGTLDNVGLPGGDVSFLYNATGPAAGGRPVAGVWNQNQIVAGRRCDHVAVFNGTTWFVDFTTTCYTPTSAPPAAAIVTAARGRPIAADFNGDGDDDAGLFRSTTNVFSLDFASDDDFQVDTNITFGFNTVNQWPVAADWDADRDGNIGLFVADRNGMFPSEAAEWYLDLGRPFTGPLSGFTSARFGGPGAQPANPGDGLFQPPPTGGLPGAPNLPFVFQDIFYQFGDQLAEPIVGNFDPPAGGSDVSGAVVRPLVRQDHAATPNDAATPLFVWDGASKGNESGSIEAAGDKDVFRFTPTESGRVAIDVKKDNSGLDTNLTVYNSTGGQVARNANFGGSTDSHVEISVVTGQTYYIAVTGTRRTKGDYGVLVDYLLGGAPSTHGDDHGDKPETGTPLDLAPATTTRSGGRIDRTGDVDFFVFSPTVNGRVELNVGALTTGLNTALEVYDDRGRLIASNDNADRTTKNSRVTGNVVAGRTYYFAVRAVGTKRGDYSVAIDWLLVSDL